MSDPRLRQVQQELDQAGLLEPFFTHLLTELPDESLEQAMGGLSLEVKLRVLQPLLQTMKPEEWAVIGQLLQQVQGGGE